MLTEGACSSVATIAGVFFNLTSAMGLRVGAPGPRAQADAMGLGAGFVPHDAEVRQVKDHSSTSRHLHLHRDARDDRADLGHDGRHEPDNEDENPFGSSHHNDQQDVS